MTRLGDEELMNRKSWHRFPAESLDFSLLLSVQVGSESYQVSCSMGAVTWKPTGCHHLVSGTRMSATVPSVLSEDC